MTDRAGRPIAGNAKAPIKYPLQRALESAPAGALIRVSAGII
eukprot:COSAG02_NODE_47698_length_339_cov_0.850000_1_plen_41_part_10